MNVLQFMKRAASRIGMASILVLTLASCGEKQTGHQGDVTILRVGWVLENIDQSYWTGSSSVIPSAFVDFWIKFEETDLTAEDILSVEITDPAGVYWTFDTPQDIAEHFDEENDYFGGWLRLWSSYYTENGSVLPIGTYSFEVTLSNGNTDSYSRVVPAPGMAGTDGANFVFSEDYAGAAAPPDDYRALLSRAAVSSAVIAYGNTDITVEFSVEDDRVYSGTVNLYDSSDTRIGSAAKRFREDASSTLTSIINGGEVFYTEGTLNTVTLTAADIQFSSGYSLEDVAYVHVVLSDGFQYNEGSDSYDNLSTSARCSTTLEL